MAAKGVYLKKYEQYAHLLVSLFLLRIERILRNVFLVAFVLLVVLLVVLFLSYNERVRRGKYQEESTEKSIGKIKEAGLAQW